MTIIESAFEQEGVNLDTGNVSYRDYDLKFEVVLEEGTKSVHGKTTLTKTLIALKKVVHSDGNIIEFSDINNTIIAPDLTGIDPADIPTRFKAEVIPGKSQVFAFGLKIRTTLTFALLKDRVIPTFKPLNTYMRIHTGGYTHGVNWVNLGFYLNKHPRFSNLPDPDFNIQKRFDHAWDNNKTDWTEEKKTDLKTILYPHHSPDELNKITHIEIPFAVAPVYLASKHNGQEIRTNVSMLTTPRSFVKTAAIILDYLLLEAKTLRDYIPIKFKHDEPQSFHQILLTHDSWLENHRNIQIHHCDFTLCTTVTGSTNCTLDYLLQRCPNILGYHFDTSINLIHVSVNQAHYRTVQTTLTANLHSAQFPFHPAVKKPQSSNTASVLGGSIKSKYTTALSSIVTKARLHANTQPLHDSTDLASTRSNSWRRKPTIPVSIDITENYDSDFPILPVPPPTPHRPSTTTTSSVASRTTNSNDSTIATAVHHAVASAILEIRAEHQKELQALRAEFQTQTNTDPPPDVTSLQQELQSLRQSMELMMQTFTAQNATLIAHLAPPAITNHDDPPAPSPGRPRKIRSEGRRSGRGGTPVRHNLFPPDSILPTDVIMQDNSTHQAPNSPETVIAQEEDVPLGDWDTSSQGSSNNQHCTPPSSTHDACPKASGRES